MSGTRFQQVERLFRAAKALDAAARAAFLEREQRAGAEASVVAEVRSLLEQETDGFLSHPAAAEATVDVPSAAADAWRDVLARLAAHAPSGPRYTLKGEIARGGMGVIVQCFDEDLKRPLAMKVMLGRVEAAASGDTPPVDDRTLGRFLEEAQVTGQLDHPGIVPVHELGLDAHGRVYFTMKLVKGQDLRAVFDLVHADEPHNEGWNLVRALNVLLRVCEAMSYAHAKHVVHRDLKPANIMVGKFGEVFVMDWGLARVLGKKDTKDLRLQQAPVTTKTHVSSDRRDATAETPDSPLITMDGDVVGTPSYMPPEQAEGKLERLGPHSDVYAVGAMLYHLLTGTMPYVNPGARISPRTILGMVLQGPPPPVHRLVKDVPAELVAICDKAMARKVEDRYATMLDLARDLRAYLEQRVVSAYETGAFAELKKWVKRNKALAATGAAAVGAALCLASWALVERESARTNEARAVEQQGIAEERAASILRLADVKRLDDLVREQDALWPAHPEKVPAMEAWLARARELLGRLPSHETTLAELRGKGTPLSDPREDELSALREQRDAEEDDEARTSLDAQIATLETTHLRVRPHDFGEDTESRWWHDTLVALVRGLHALQADDPHGATVAGVERRLESARTLRQRSIEDHRAAWDACVVAVAADPRTGGLALTPQLGLVPLGADPDSGLQEFWHVESGERPERGADGRIVVTEGMGIVLVLIPGGTTTMGAQSSDPAAPRYDPQAQGDESPVHKVALDPFLVSKYELTQGQWQRATGANPSQFGPHNWTTAWSASGRQSDLTHPVEQVDWDQCREMLGRLGLTLPTEAQWEASCRAGMDTPWWTGTEVLDLDVAGNLADQYGKTHGANDWTSWEQGLDDGYTIHAPVGTYRPNAFGLFDTLGNVWEWCRDGSGGYDLEVREGDGERLVQAPSSRVYRGGGFGNTSVHARSAYRDDSAPSIRGHILGCRPARRLSHD